jgi:anti-sigma B factor antagonist
MRIKDHLSGNIAVFELSGKIMGGREATLFHGRIQEYINLNKRNILVDMSNVGWTNSEGLGMLLAARKRVNDAGGRLALTNIESVVSLMALTRLATVFEHFDNRADAEAALNT